MAYADLVALDPLFDESRFLTGRRPDVDAAGDVLTRAASAAAYYGSNQGVIGDPLLGT